MPHLKVRQPIVLDVRSGRDEPPSNAILGRSIAQLSRPKEEVEEAPNFAETVGRLSDDQLRSLLALSDAQVAEVRSNPDAVYGIAGGVGERADAVRLGVHQGKITPDNDSKIGGFLGALSHIVTNPIESILKGLELYDRNINTPFAATAVFAAQQLIPGDTDFEERVAENQRQGLGFLQARVKAFDETTDWPDWVRAGLKMGLDPLVFTGVLKLGPKALTLMKQAPKAVGEKALPAIAGSAGTKLGSLPKIDDVMRSVDPIDTTVLGHKILPDFLKRKIDPSSVARGVDKGSPELAIIGYRKLQAMGAAFAELAMSHIRARGPIERLFKIKDGYVKNLEGAEPAWGDLFQNPTAFKLTAEQSDFITQFHSMFDEGFDMMKREGLLTDEDKIEFVSEMMHYVPRLDITEGRKVLRLKSTRPVGADPFFVKTRMFDTMQQGMYAGETYADPLATASAYLKSLYERVAAERFKVAIQPLIDTVGGEGKVLITHHLFREGSWVNKEVYESVAKLLDDRGAGAAIKAVSGLSGTLRTARATTDMSTPFIQGQLLLFTNPRAWATSVKKSYEAFIDPSVRARYIAENADHIMDMVGHDMILGSSEFTEALRTGGWFAKLPSSPVFRQTIGRFQSAFETYLDIGRIETTKALYQTALRSGPKGLNELSGFANKLLGAIDTAAMGVPLSQRQLESAVLFFAPRYTRAIAALMLDMTRGGLRGDQARAAFGHLAAGMAVTHYAVAKALGQEPNLDPSSRQFLKVKLNGVWVGPGGKARSFIKTGASIVKASYEEPMGLLHVNIFDPESSRNNPIIRWLRSGAAPGASMIMSMLVGEDAIGRALALDEPLDWLKFAKTDLLPFAVGAAWESGQFDPTAFSAEFLGLISNEVTATDQRREMRDKFAKAAHSAEWNQLALDQQSQIREAHPELVEVERLSEVEQGRYRSSKRRLEAFDALDTAKKRQVDALNVAGRAFELGVDGARRGFRFRQRISEAAAKYGEARIVLESGYSDVFDEIQRLKSREGQNVVNVAFDDYVSRVFGLETADPITGDYDYEAADGVKNELRAQYGDDVIGRVEAELQRRKRNPSVGDLHPVVLQYYDALDELRPYWEVWKVALKGKALAAYAAFQNAPKATQEQLLRSSPIIRQANARVKVAQLLMRRDNAQVDWWLHLYYDNVPANQDNIMKLRRS